MSNIVASSCPVVAASYVPPAPRRPLLVTPSSTHFKAASYIGCSLGSLLHCAFFSIVIQLISTPTTHPLTLPTLPPLCHSYSHLIFFLLQNVCGSTQGANYREGSVSRHTRASFHSQHTSCDTTQKVFMDSSKTIHKPTLKTLT